MTHDLLFVLQWWVTLFAVGIIFLPLTKLLFPNVRDNFYIFSKIIGAGLMSYALFLFGTLHVLPFSKISVFGVLLIMLGLNLFILKKVLFYKKPRINKALFKRSSIFIFEELLFLACIVFWTYIRGHEPSIHGLEKYMDFGFVNSIIRADYFPPKDMWFTPLPINYYFFGHLVTAVLTILSGLPSNISYNLMIATLFAFSLVGGFSLVFNFLYEKGVKRAITGGLLGGTLLSLGGNLHTMYAFFSVYNGEKPVAPWTLTFLPNLFPNGYWYPNATRFIQYTIHEFPLYSFVVSDLHGHVLDIPFVLLGLALLYSAIKDRVFSKLKIVSFGLLLAIMYMTNVWDSVIYLFLLGLVLFFIYKREVIFKFHKNQYVLGFRKLKKVTGLRELLFNVGFTGGIIAVLFIVFTLPFSIFFKPFVSGIGVICPPQFLIDIGKIGPFLFEADHCQRSPFYQLVILYGFFAFFVFSFLVVFLRGIRKKKKQIAVSPTQVFVFLLIIISFLLIIVPEFLYAKDIYPQHYRANTMFKLVYQSFMMLSLVSAYTIIDVLSRRATTAIQTVSRILFIIITFVALCLVYLYPYFAIKSYYADLRAYKTIDGTEYLKVLHPGDYEAIVFLNNSVSGQPVILEAQGDSYTDYARISANTGLPTVLGWTVHEWLWRGSYDIPAPRIEEVKAMYLGNEQTALPLIRKYNVSYIVVGSLEIQKYPGLNPNKFSSIGNVVFRSSDNQTVIYKVKEQYWTLE